MAEESANLLLEYMRPFDAKLDVIHGFDPAWPFGQYDHLIRKRYGFFDIVRNQQQRSPAFANQLRRVAFNQQLVLEIERSEGFIEQ